MDHDPDEVAGGSDAELITRVRSGDRAAFGQLYSRHAGAAANLARQFARAPSEVDDLVSEAFARVLDSLLGGRGPDSAFRAYLFTTLRNTAFDRTRKDRRLQFTDDITVHESPEVADDPVVLQLENTLVAKAFGALPERWQTVLWHTQVEGQSPAEVGVLLGMAPNAVTSLAFRAREGLREAYLQAHLADTAAERCRATVDRLGGWARGGLSKRERTQVDAHLADCERCSALAAELAEINTSLRGLLAPLLLGGAAAGYLASLGNAGIAVPLGAATGATVGTAAVGTTAGSTAAGSTAGTATGHGAGAGGAGAAAGSSSSWGLWGLLARPWALATAGAGVAAAVVTGVVIAFGGTGAQQPLANEPPPVSPVTNSPGTGSTAGTGPSGGTGVTGTSTVTGSSASTPSSPATSGSSGPGTTPVQPTGTRPTTAGSDSGTGGPGGSTGGQTLPPVVVPGSPGTTSTASSAISPSTAPTTSIPSTVFTTISTGVPSSPAPGSSTSGTPITSSTPPATSTSSSTSSTTSPPVTTPPTAELSDPEITVPSLSGTAGAPSTMSYTVRNRGHVDSAPQTVQISAPHGITLAGASSTITDPTTSDLRWFSALMALRLAPATATTLDCSDEGCTYTVPATKTITVTLSLDVAPDALPGDIYLVINRQPTGPPLPIKVAPGLLQLQLAAPSTGWKAGATTIAELTGTAAAGVTDVGTITLPRNIGAAWIDPTSGNSRCTPIEDGTQLACAGTHQGDGFDFGTVSISVMPGAAGTLDLKAVLPGQHSDLKLTGPPNENDPDGAPLMVQPLPPTAMARLTGPFEATQIGAPTMTCKGKESRDSCTGEKPMTELNPVAVETLSLDEGESVVWASMSWATLPSADQDSSNVKVWINGLEHDYPADSEQNLSAIDVYSADMSEELAGLSGNVTVSVDDLVASMNSMHIGGTEYPALGAWSLTVLIAHYSDPTPNTVTYRNATTVSTSTADSVCLVSRGADPHSDCIVDSAAAEFLSATLWGADDWGTKAIEDSDHSEAPLYVPTGEFNGEGSGLDLAKIALPVGGDIILTNRARDGSDTLWVGPMITTVTLSR